MNVDKDPLDQAFGLLKARSQGRVPTNPELEELVMKDLANSDRPKVKRLSKVAAAIVICAVGTGAAAATGGMDSLMDWVSLTGFYESPDGKTNGYVENGRLISGETSFQGVEYSVEDGHMVNADGNLIGSVHVEVTHGCEDGSCDDASGGNDD